MAINNPYIPGDPYSYDLKWIVDQVKTAVEEYTTVVSDYNQLIHDFGALEQYVNDYFANLDLSSEVSAILEQMRVDGTLSQLIGSIIVSEDMLSPIVANWLADNIGPTTPAIDASLSIAGAGADAYQTGLVRDMAIDAKNQSTENGLVLDVAFDWSSTNINMADNDHLITGGIQANGTINTTGAWGTYKTTPEIHILTTGTYYWAVYKLTPTTPATQRHITYIKHADNTTEWYNPDNQYTTTLSLLAGDTVQIAADTPTIGFMFVEDPNSPVPFTPNGISNVEFSAYGKTLIRNVVGMTDTIMTLTKSTDSYTIQCNDFTITDYITRLGYNNETFNFSTAALDPYGSIKTCTDDITPLRLVKTGVWGQSTVGANHGWNCFTLNQQTVDDTDVGSIWTDGSETFTLMNVSGGLAYFFWLSDPINRPAPGASLSSSDAIHQTPLSIASYAATQFFPSINNREVHLYNSTHDEITTAGVYDDFKFYVVERYSVIDYMGAQTWLNANIGSSVTDPDVPALLTIYNTYTHMNTFCIVDTLYQFHDACTMTDCGALQAAFLVNANGTPKGVWDNANSGIDFGNPGGTNLWDPRGTDIIATPSDVINAAQPITNFNQYVVDGGGDILYGFLFGYFPDKGSGKDSERLGLPQYWNNATFNKSYPTVFYNKAVSAGDIFETVGYRLYYKGTDLKSWSLGKDLYVFVSNTGTITDAISLPDYYGYNVEMLTSVNASLDSDIVGTAGIVYTITGGGCALFKVSK